MSTEKKPISEREKIINKLNNSLVLLEKDTKKEIDSIDKKYFDELSKQFDSLLKTYSNKVQIQDSNSKKKQKEKSNKQLNQLNTLFQTLLKDELSKSNAFEETLKNEEQSERNKITTSYFKEMDVYFQEYFNAFSPFQEKYKEQEKASRQFFKNVQNEINSMANCDEDIIEKYRREKWEKDATLLRDSLKHIYDEIDGIYEKHSQLSDRDKHTFILNIEDARHQLLTQMKQMIEKIFYQQKKTESLPVEKVTTADTSSKLSGLTNEVDNIIRSSIKKVQQLQSKHQKQLGTEHEKWKKAAKERILAFIGSMDTNYEKVEETMISQWLLDRDKINDEFDAKTNDRSEKLREEFVKASQEYFRSVKAKEDEIRSNTEKQLAQYIHELQNQRKHKTSKSVQKQKASKKSI